MKGEYQGSDNRDVLSPGSIALLWAYSDHLSNHVSIPKPADSQRGGDHFSQTNAPDWTGHHNHLITPKAVLLFCTTPVFFCLLPCFHRQFRLPVVWKPGFKDKAVPQIFILPPRIGQLRAPLSSGERKSTDPATGTVGKGKAILHAPNGRAAILC